MARPRLVAVAVVLVALALGSLATETLVRPGADPETSAYAETIGFALSTPAGLVLLAYLLDGFDFGTYFGSRDVAGLGGDLVLSVLGGAVVGLPATAAILLVTDSTTVLYVGGGLFTFVGAFVVFLYVTREYFSAEPAAG